MASKVGLLVKPQDAPKAAFSSLSTARRQLRCMSMAESNVGIVVPSLQPWIMNALMIFIKATLSFHFSIG